jgi:hypothetical protein
VRSTKRTGASSAVGEADFAEALSAAEEAAAAAGAEAPVNVAGVGGVGAFLGAQEVDEREMQRRRAVKRGRLTLDALSQLRDALLMGSLPLSTIQKLEAIVAAERGTTTDPVLQSILDDIEIRAAVEIAKLEVAGVIPPKE